MEVKLNRCALERSAQRVFDRDIDFRAIESTVSRVEPPFAGVVFVESVCQLLETSLLGVFANIEYRLANLFGKIPSLDLAKELLWSRGELKGEFEAKHAVDSLHEIEKIRNLLFNLNKIRKGNELNALLQCYLV